VPDVAIDNRYLDFVCADLELIECARRADSAPQTGKAGTKDEDPCHQGLFASTV
jgi:hypothetical protein